MCIRDRRRSVDDADIPSDGARDSSDPTRRPAVGTVRVGARADLHVLQAPSATHLAYRPGMDLSGDVWRAGRRLR